MLIIHAVQKLLNTSRQKALLYISEPSPGQLMHSWYARLLATGFTGKLLVMYVHEPSLLTVVCRGKTLAGTWPTFLERWELLMKRTGFGELFIRNEVELADGYVIAKTTSKSILAHMNQMVFQLEYDCTRFSSYESISLDFLEDVMWNYLYSTGNSKKPYISPKDYWSKYL